MIHSFIIQQIAQYLGKDALNQANLVVKVMRVLWFILSDKEKDCFPYERKKKIRSLVSYCFTITTHA